MMIPILHSVSYAGLWGQSPLGVTEFIAKAAALGYSGVMLTAKRPHVSVVDVTDEEIDAIREAAEVTGVELATFAGYTNFTMGRTSEIPSDEMQILYVRRLAEIARRLGIKIIRIFTGYGTDPEAYYPDWRHCIRCVRECARAAADQGVVIGLQNHHDVGVGVDGYAEFLDEVDHPNCKAMFDPWVPALHGDDMRAAARRLAPRMVQTTLADYVRLPRYEYMPGLVNYKRLHDTVRAVPLGEGLLDLDAFFAGLTEGGFDGYVAYEMCSPLRGGGSLENLETTARRSLDKIRQLIGAA
ncbi:MAG: sugar phosphate isomerase/epimerase [Planctomycetia bacterium]|nr:sugar phosphate isomerase/epimerase [Planctomycetia bacterium]